MLVEDPEGIKQIMKDCKTIAIVGFSDDPGKAGYFVADYLKSVGYKIIPVNPNLKWGLKEKCYSSLLDIPKDEKVDMVDCFRRSEFTLTLQGMPLPSAQKCCGCKRVSKMKKRSKSLRTQA